eukprot:CAMPEP_0184706946 /NCGR_PEP_ID=MMETSP0313-20130426/37019_1 /TAXON_ID=2792 /ORGANISM="Porphyridium aerugineum, Strain SAG 1380-2" /LENGTH=1014 /DNA_ID=CAMNT_0027168515 /DNA_START=256 /DNA_END=3297 /DNA_ORIENTATION=-
MARNNHMALAMVIVLAVTIARLASAAKVPDRRIYANRQDANPCLAQKLCIDEYFEFATFSEMPNVTFITCQFLGAFFTGNNDGMSFDSCYLDSPFFEAVSMVESKWKNSVLTVGSLTDFTLEGSVFENSYFTRSSAVAAEGTKSSFVNVVMDRFNLGYENDFTRVNFSGAVVRPAETPAAPYPLFSAAYQSGYNSLDPTASFTLMGAKLISTDFRGVDLSGSVFAYSDLTGADFSDANLSYTNVYQAVFDDSTVIQGADFTGAVGFFEALGLEGCQAFCQTSGCLCTAINFCESSGQKLGPGVECQSMRLNYYTQNGDLNNAVFEQFQIEAVTFGNINTSGEIPDIKDMDVTKFNLKNSWVNRAQFVRPKNAGSNSVNRKMNFESDMLRDILFLASDIDGLSFNGTEQHGVEFRAGSIQNINYSDSVLYTGVPQRVDPIFYEQIAKDNGFTGDTTNQLPIAVSNIRFDHVYGEELDGSYPISFFFADVENFAITDSNISLGMAQCERIEGFTIQKSIIPVLLIIMSNLQSVNIEETDIWTAGISGVRPRSRRSKKDGDSRMPNITVEEALHGFAESTKGLSTEYKTFASSRFNNVSSNGFGFRSMDIKDFSLSNSQFLEFGFDECAVTDSNFANWYALYFGSIATDISDSTFVNTVWDSFDIFENSTTKDVTFVNGTLAQGTFAGTYNNVSFRDVVFDNVTFVGYPASFTNLALTGSNVNQTTGLFRQASAKHSVRRSSAAAHLSDPDAVVRAPLQRPVLPLDRAQFPPRQKVRLPKQQLQLRPQPRLPPRVQAPIQARFRAGTFAGTYNNVSFRDVVFDNVTFVGYPASFTNLVLTGSNVLKTTGLFVPGQCQTFCATMQCCCTGIGAGCDGMDPSRSPFPSRMPLTFQLPSASHGPSIGTISMQRPLTQRPPSRKTLRKTPSKTSRKTPRSSFILSSTVSQNPSVIPSFVPSAVSESILVRNLEHLSPTEEYTESPTEQPWTELSSESPTEQPSTELSSESPTEQPSMDPST